MLSTSSNAHEGLGDFPSFMGARACHDHLGQSFRNVEDVSAILIKHLCMEVAFPVSGDLNILEPAR